MTSAYLRLHRYQRPTLGVAVAVVALNQVVEDVRLAVGCVGPKAQRLSALETKVKGARLSDVKRILAQEKTYLRELLRPVDDLLGGADYKLYMTGALLADALGQATRNGRTRQEDNWQHE
jgi:CO/xanthine dehydrogenase FAD-binding subunit